MPGNLPERLGPYQIGDKLGAGGMGEVYRARDTRLDRDVAIKVILQERSDEATLQSRFAREARAASALNHPNIVCVYDVGEQDGTQYIVSELVQGESLRQMISRGPLPPAQSVKIATQLADALKAAHAAGIVHRDLKPENIRVTSEGRVKVLDFGLARRIQRTSDPDRTVTQTTAGHGGMAIGTAGYMSPEQICGEEADYRSDIFSAGVVLYEMASGARAFTGRTSFEMMSAVLKDDPPRLPAKASAGLDRIIRRCLEKDPAKRYQSASELHSALEGANVPAMRIPGPRRRWVGWAAALAAGIVAAGVYWQAERRPPPLPAVALPVPAPNALPPQPRPSVVQTAPHVMKARPPKTHEAYQKAYEEGMLLLSRRKWADGVERLSEAIRLKPDSALAHLGRCRAEVALEQHQQAIVDCTEVIQRLPNSATAFHERGTAYFRVAQFDRAVEDMNAALRLGDDAPGFAHSIRGRAHSGLKEWEDAIQDFDEAIKLNPAVGQFFMFRGIALNARRQFRKALDDFNEALRLQPNLPMAYHQRALAKARLGDIAGAAADREQAKSLRK